AHLFVIYWASVSYITPPVGLAAFAAAGISKASPMATCVEAMRLGAVKYIVPFGFALNPALVAQDDPGRVAVAFVFSLVAVYAIAGALGGHLALVERRVPLWARAALVVGGFMMFLPQMWVTLLGLALTAVVVVLVRLTVPGNLPPEPVVDPDGLTDGADRPVPAHV
ncbi:TRAP transporter large permease subunit, partial [Streptomyces rishiriensis]|uniref:TRAP transporter large permease subunit n=1 Tax=Streptomyces rishiriensis TaxID=68264 RepID=UPI0037B32951